MKFLYIDLDGVVADFVSAMNTHPKKDTPPYQGEVHDEVEDDFDLVRDKVLEDTEWPELIEE